jgi:hypothetical protein
MLLRGKKKEQMKRKVLRRNRAEEHNERGKETKSAKEWGGKTEINEVREVQYTYIL